MFIFLNYSLHLYSSPPYYDSYYNITIILANSYHRLLLLLHKSDNACILHIKIIKIKKITDCVLVVRFLIMTALQICYYVTLPYYCVVLNLRQGIETPLQYLFYGICHHLCFCLRLRMC